MPQEGDEVQMVADAVELQTNFDSEAGFNMSVGAEGWSSDCSMRRPRKIASPPMGGKVKDSRPPSENRPGHRKSWKPSLQSW